MKTNYTRLKESKTQPKPELALFTGQGGLREDIKDFEKTRREICAELKAPKGPYNSLGG